MGSHLGLQNLFSFRLLGIIFFAGTILGKSVQSTDLSKYEACKPRNCGNGPNISYPFYIGDAGTDFCGYPEFRIECKEKKPIYRTSKGYFTIQDISYENQSFRLLDEAVLNDTCVVPVQNFSFDRSALKFIPYHADLYLFHNCNTSFYLNYTTSEVTCAANATSNTTTFVALVRRDEDLNWSRIACDSVISSPVQLGEEEIHRTVKGFDYVKLLKDGFSLKWSGYNCAECRKGGGQCGFENENSVCFCPDGSHPYSCNDGDGKLRLRLGLGLGTLSAGICILIILAYCFKKKLCSANSIIFWKKTAKNYQNIEAFLRNCGSLALKRYTYSDIKKMTNSFKHKLGQGGYGGVYKGKLLDGRNIAVKVLNESKGNGEDFINEVASISRTSHINIVDSFGLLFRGQQKSSHL